MSARNITYVVLTCLRNQQLVNAQLDTCLNGQTVHIESDEDEEDTVIGRNGTGTKLLRALWRVRELKLSADWIFLVDDDAWVNPLALQRACSCLDAKQPFISTCVCMRTSVAGDGGEGYRRVFDEAAWNRVIAWWEGASRVPGMTTFYHGGGGMLMSGSLWRELRRTAFNHDESTPGFAQLCHDGMHHEGPLAGLFQDRLLAVLVNLTRKRLDIVQRPIRGLRLNGTDGKPRWPTPQNDWEASGTGIVVGNSSDEKRICDLNVRHPTKADGSLDADKAVRLHFANKKPRTKGDGREQHIAAGQANLVTWHRFKEPSMYEAMQVAVDRGRSMGLWWEGVTQ